MNSFYTPKELKSLGIKSYGENVLISRKASIYSPEKISIGTNVRIDDFCILSGSIQLGSNIHVSAYCALYGQFGIEMKDFSGLSPRCTVLSASDDFSGNYLIGPMIPEKYTHVTGGKVLIEKYVQIGAGNIILPDVVIGEGVTTGALTLINKSLESWSIYVGSPARFLKARSKGLLSQVEDFNSDLL
jgi:acetyltransferase-like isoleucine patch superfamily enzyme